MRHSFASLVAASLIILAAACGPATTGSGDDAGGDDTVCTDGQTRCDGTARQSCVDGAWSTVETCANVCDNDLGCVVCLPGTGTCNGDTAHECRLDGSGYDDVFCDPDQGMSCGASGTCEGLCAPNTLGQTYFGCDYWPTVTGNPVSPDYHYAVVVANTSSQMATIRVDGGALTAQESFTVPGGAAVVHNLPWVAALKLCTPGVQDPFTCTSQTHPNSGLAVDGAYHLRSDVPVTVYQFNPIEYAYSGVTYNSYTNDASLLFPTTAWRGEHYVASWNDTADVHPGLMAITAYQDGTQVTVTTRAATTGEGGAPAMVAGTPQTVTLNAGDVLQLGTVTGNGPNDDLTGSHVTSDKPVQVIGGHYCANVPEGFGYCDHMEEVMLSVEALGAEYVINAPAVTTIPAGKEETVRIVATEAGTTLSYEPPQAGAPTSIANAGDWVEIPRQAASYLLTANKKVLVAQFMEGSSVAGNTGDPAMALAVPVDQFRKEYLFHAPTNYETNYVDITAPVGASVILDGVAVTGWIGIGTSGWQLARITPLGDGPTADGNHLITGDMGFGISVYGYGTDTSYWYPGGLDLKRVVVE
ncbi:MAG: IgGFc-binding protein [Kofleriaceae bacterium]|nr:IgGFc-binding protein [Kofleriaceae bacterium]